MIVPSVIALSVLARTASAAVASTFTTPAPAPTSQSSFYTGPSNGTITNSPLVPGKVFDRFIQIWLENTDFASAASQPAFSNLSTQGITLTGYYGVTHPSEPNYLAAAGGDYWGLASDSLEAIPSNISTIADLLDQKNISWSSYQENMPTDGYTGYNYTNPGDGYTYYVRKHNPLIIYDTVSTVPSRAARIRNFNDFAVDVGNNTLSQWIFITPNLRDDGHDTDAAYASEWLTWWLMPLLNDPNFNTNRTLILLTFDENETYTIGNAVYSILLGGAVPQNLRGSTDSTFYTHYSTLSTVENNWDLGNLGRQDTNKTVSNVFSFVAAATSYKNNGLTNTSSLPQLNLTGTTPGPLNPDYYIPYLAPNTSATGGGSGATFVEPGVNMSLTSATPVNISATASTNGTTSTGAAIGLVSNANNMVAVVAVAVVGAMLL